MQRKRAATNPCLTAAKSAPTALFVTKAPMARRKPAPALKRSGPAPAEARGTHRLSVPWYYCVYKREEAGLLRLSHVGYEHVIKHVPKTLSVRELRDGYQRGNAVSAMRAPMMVLLGSGGAEVYSAVGWRREMEAGQYSTDVTGWASSGRHLYVNECENEAFAELRFFATINAYAVDAALCVPRLETVNTMYCASVYLPLTLECDADVAVLEREFSKCREKACRDSVLTITTPEGGLSVYHECDHAPMRKRRCTVGPRTPSVPPPCAGTSSGSSSEASTSGGSTGASTGSSGDTSMMRASFETGLYLSDSVMRSLCCARGKGDETPD